jgi:hypothetical protein
MTQQHPIAVAKNGCHNPDRTGVVSEDRHRPILTHADLPRSGRYGAWRPWGGCGAIMHDER